MPLQSFIFLDKIPLELRESLLLKAFNGMKIFFDKKAPSHMCAFLFPEYTAKLNYMQHTELSFQIKRLKIINLYLWLCKTMQNDQPIIHIIDILIEKRWDRDPHKETLYFAAKNAAFALLEMISTKLFRKIICSDSEYIGMMKKVYEYYIIIQSLISILSTKKLFRCQIEQLVTFCDEILSNTYNFCILKSTSVHSVQDIIAWCKKEWPQCKMKNAISIQK